MVCLTLFVICSSGSPSAFAHGWPFFSFWSCLYAVANDVIVFCLPPNTTHFLQPLDNGPFGPLKRYWRQECHSFCNRNPGRVVTKLQFNQLFSRAWSQGMTMQNIVAGFQHAGVYPFRRPEEEDTSIQRSSLANSINIRYLPFHTPKQRRRIRPSHTIVTGKKSI